MGTFDFALIIAPDESKPENASENYIPVPSKHHIVGDYTETLTTDFIYGGLASRDSNGQNFPVGRLPFSRLEQLEEYIDRVTRRYAGPKNDSVIGVAGDVQGFNEYSSVRDELAHKAFLQFPIRVYDYGRSFGRSEFWRTYHRDWRWFSIVGHGTFDQFWMNQTAVPTITVKHFSEDRSGKKSDRWHLWFVGCLAGKPTRAGYNLAEAAISQEDGPLTVLAASAVNYHVSNYLLLSLALE